MDTSDTFILSEVSPASPIDSNVVGDATPARILNFGAPSPSPTGTPDLTHDGGKARYCLDRILLNRVTNTSAPGLVEVLKEEHVAVNTPENVRFVQNWINNLYQRESSYRQLWLSNPSKAVRDSKNEFSSSVSPMTWNIMQTYAELDGETIPTDRVGLNEFILTQILKRTAELFATDTQSVSLLQRIKPEFAWNDQHLPEFNFITLITAIKRWTKENSSYTCSDEEILGVVFALIPFGWTKYFICKFSNFIKRFANKAEVVPGIYSNPIDTMSFSSMEELKTFFSDSSKVTKIIQQQLRFLNLTYEGAKINPDSLPGVTDGLPPMKSNAFLQHLYPPHWNNNGAKNSTPKVNSVDVKRAPASPTKKLKSNKPDEGGERKKICWNCRVEGHTFYDCTFNCTRCPFKDGDVTHLMVNCPKRADKKSDKTGKVVKPNIP
jgi:hypothetical protein